MKDRYLEVNGKLLFVRIKGEGDPIIFIKINDQQLLGMLYFLMPFPNNC